MKRVVIDLVISLVKKNIKVESNMRDKIKIVPMTHQQIRAEFKKMDDKADRLKTCGLSFDNMMDNIKSSTKK